MRTRKNTRGVMGLTHVRAVAALTVLLATLWAVGCDDSTTTTTPPPSTTAASTSSTASPGSSATSAAEPAATTTTTVAATTSTASTPTTSSAPYTPPRGDPERTEIMDAQRAYMADHGLPSDVVFVVEWLRVQDGWAYSTVNPQSPDGAAQYETLVFLLRDRGGWNVVDVFGAGGEFAEDLDPADTLRARNPAAPAGIFP